MSAFASSVRATSKRERAVAGKRARTRRGMCDSHRRELGPPKIIYADKIFMFVGSKRRGSARVQQDQPNSKEMSATTVGIERRINIGQGMQKAVATRPNFGSDATARLLPTAVHSLVEPAAARLEIKAEISVH